MKESRENGSNSHKFYSVLDHESETSDIICRKKRKIVRIESYSNDNETDKKRTFRTNI